MDVSQLSPCTHEESDVRMFLHIASACHSGHRCLIIRSNDSDVVVLGVSAFVALRPRIDKLWVAFGVRQHFRYISKLIHIHLHVNIIFIII